MVIEREAFERTRLDDERAKDKSKVIPVRLNIAELERLEADALVLKQEKPSTALKQLAEIGHFVIHRPEMMFVIDVVFNNERKNKRIGLDLIDPRFKQM